MFTCFPRKVLTLAHHRSWWSVEHQFSYAKTFEVLGKLVWPRRGFGKLVGQRQGVWAQLAPQFLRVFLAAAASGLWFRSCAGQEGAERACGLLVVAHLLLMILQSFSFHC